MHDSDNHTAAFDQQAKAYDKRAGLSESVCRAIAESLKTAASLSEQDTVLELGCGTGQIGSMLDALPCSYHGFDLSEGMLEQFRNNHPDISGTLTQADGRSQWPLESGTAKVIFASRALHWLKIEHIVNEAYRVTKDDEGYLFVGRVEKPANGWEDQMREQLHQLLRDNSLTPLDGRNHLKELTQALSEKGAEVLKPITVDSWQSKRTISKLIQNWTGKEGLAGTQPSAELKNLLLQQLQQWAEDTFDSPLPSGSERSYIIYGFKLSR